MTTRPMPAYAHGAVSEVRDPILVSQIAALNAAVPISALHRELLREIGSEFVYARPLDPPVERAGWLVLVRFGSVVESRFGFTREIPLVYSPFSDLQIRTTDSLEARLSRLPAERRSVSTNEVLVWAPDSRLTTKLDSWSRPARVLLPLPDEADLAHPERIQRFVDLLASRLASRDLYSVRGYVTGDQFFGRKVELQQVADCVRRREVVGVLGLRKTGKTSLINELKRAHDSERDQSERLQLFVYQDLEHLPSLSEDPVSELVQDLAENIRRRLKQEGLRTHELTELSNDATPSDFRRAFDRLLEKLDKQATITLLLDEIEYLCPPNPGADTSGVGFQRVRQFFGGLRKLVQERDNFTFVLAGLSSSAIESPELYGAPNPLFSFARPLYLGPLSYDEVEELLNGIGRKVSLHWQPDAVSLVRQVSGGHALLVRELASGVLQDQRHSRSNTVHIRPGMIHQVLPKWKIAVASHVRDVLPHLRRYYGDEADLAVMLIEDPESFREFLTSYGDSIQRLVELGIVVPSDGGWRAAPLLQFSYEFESRPDPERQVGVLAQASLPIGELLVLEESETIERKESLRAHGGAVPDEKIVDQVLKACLGFLNRKGGSVLVGVSDNGEIVGVQRDIDRCGSVDSLVKFLTDKIRTKIGGPGIDLLDVSTSVISEKIVLVLRCSASPEPVFPLKPVDGKEGLFVRNNNTTQVLVGKEALEYAQRHWRK